MQRRASLRKSERGIERFLFAKLLTAAVACQRRRCRASSCLTTTSHIKKEPRLFEGELETFISHTQKKKKVKGDDSTHTHTPLRTHVDERKRGEPCPRAVSNNTLIPRTWNCSGGSALSRRHTRTHARTHARTRARQKEHKKFLFLGFFTHTHTFAS